MMKWNFVFTKAEHTAYDVIYHIAFAVVLCLYSFLILFSSKLLGFLFFLSGMALISATVWRGIKTAQSVIAVVFLLCLLFFSRLFWMNAFHILPVFFYGIFQAVFFIGFGIGITLLYSLMHKSAPLSGNRNKHAVHLSYFMTGLFLITYTWLYSYGAIIQGDYSRLVWAVLILMLWICLYYFQLLYNKKQIMRAALYVVNIGVGCWAFYRWIHVFA
jgi:hypothetical protein